MFLESRRARTLPWILPTLLVIVLALAYWMLWQQRSLLSDVQTHLTRIDEQQATLEQIYTLNDCVVSVGEDGTCEWMESSKLALAAPDRDGEVRALVLYDASGTQTRIAPLTQEYSYVRVRHEDGTLEGYVSDREQGLLEVYLAKPKLTDISLQRLPILLKVVNFPTANTAQ